MKYNSNEIEEIMENGEPIFVLRATDELASHAIKAYLVLYQAKYGIGFSFQDSLENVIEQFKDWQNENGCKRPD